MSSHPSEFKDEKIAHVIHKIREFNPGSFMQELGKYDKKVLSTIEADRGNKILSWMILVELNFAVLVFGSYDQRFRRGLRRAKYDDIAQLIEGISNEIRLPFELSKYALFFGTPPESLESRLYGILDKLHKNELQNSEYDWLNYLSFCLAGTFLLFSLKWYQKLGLPNLKQLLDRAALKAYTLKFFQLRLTKEIIAKAIGDGKQLVRIEGNPIQKFVNPFVLTPDKLSSCSLQDFVINQPCLYLTKSGEYHLHRLDRPMIYCRSLAISELDSISRKYTNLEGDSFEQLVRIYLSEKTCHFDINAMDVRTKSKQQFKFIPNRKITRSQAPELFDNLPQVGKPELEIDGVANHESGYSVIIESKFCSKTGNARKYYYSGIGDSWAVQPTLKAIIRYLEKYPNMKYLFGIPKDNKVFAAFTTNQHGRFFSDQDGIAKISILEILFEGRFQKLFS